MGDSTIIIEAIISRRNPPNVAMHQILNRIRQNMEALGNVTFKHISRENNSFTDHHANLAVARSEGETRVAEDVFLTPIPWSYRPYMKTMSKISSIDYISCFNANVLCCTHTYPRSESFSVDRAWRSCDSTRITLRNFFQSALRYAICLQSSSPRSSFLPS